MVTSAEIVGLQSKLSWQGLVGELSIGEPPRPPEVPEEFEETLIEEETTDPYLHYVYMMNARSLLERQAIFESASDEDGGQQLFSLVMFGHGEQPLGRRDASLPDLQDATIQEAVRNAWADCRGPFELYDVVPQPERLRGEGWVTLVYVRNQGNAHPLGKVMILKEIVTYRHTRAFAGPLPEHEAFFVTPRNAWRPLLREVDLEERCDSTRHGSCSILLRGNVVLRGAIIRMLTGDLISFLVDEALPPAQDIVIFADPIHFAMNYEQALGTMAPMQFVAVYTHGYHGGFLGTRSFATHRPNLLDFGRFAAQIVALWQEEVFQNIEVHCVIPQLVRRESSGEVEMHYILHFGTLRNPLILLRRTLANSWATPYQLLSLAGWLPMLEQHGLPDVSWGQSELAIDDLLQMRTGMEIAFTANIDEGVVEEELMPEDEELSHLQILWFASDLHHGRTLGANGFRQLRPPGNGHRGRQVSFSDKIWIVEEDFEQVYSFKQSNPFREEMTSAIIQDPQEDLNTFLWDFRFRWDKQHDIYEEDNPFISGWKNQMAVSAFANPMICATCSEANGYVRELRLADYVDQPEVEEAHQVDQIYAEEIPHII